MMSLFGPETGPSLAQEPSYVIKSGFRSVF